MKNGTLLFVAFIICWFVYAGVSWKQPMHNSKTWAFPTRAINGSSFTPSTDKHTTAFYTVELSCTAYIGSNAQATVSLQFQDEAGNWVDAGSAKNSNTVTLAIALNSVTIQRSVIAAEIPAGRAARMNTSTTGTSTATFIMAMEVYTEQ